MTKDRTTFLLEQAEIELRDGHYFEVKGDDLRIVVEALKLARAEPEQNATPGATVADEMRRRMIRDEELSEEDFRAFAIRIAYEAHEDRLKLWESLHTDPRTGAKLSHEPCEQRLHEKGSQPGETEPRHSIPGSAVPTVGTSTVDAGTRTDHAENLAKALEHYLNAHDTLSGVQSADDATGQNDAYDSGFSDAANDAWRAMRTALFEYRKHRSSEIGRGSMTKTMTHADELARLRAALQWIADYPDPVGRKEPWHEAWHQCVWKAEESLNGPSVKSEAVECDHPRSEFLARKGDAFEMRKCLDCTKVFRVRLACEKLQAECHDQHCSTHRPTALRTGE